MVGDEEEQEARGAAGGFGKCEPMALRYLVGGYPGREGCSKVCHDQKTAWLASADCFRLVK
jgi:hypothetical protein